METKVITFAHKKGGTGKTSNCINAAVELSKEFDTIVVDLDSLKQTTKFNNRRSKPFNQVEISDHKGFIELIKNTQGEGKLIIVDLGGYDSDLSRYVLLLTDLIIIPLSKSDNDLDGLVEFSSIMQEVIETQDTDIKCKILVNRVHHADTKTHKLLKDSLSAPAFKKFDIFDTVIRENRYYGEMLGTGKAITEHTSGTPAILVNNLIKEIKKDLGV